MGGFSFSAAFAVYFFGFIGFLIGRCTADLTAIDLFTSGLSWEVFTQVFLRMRGF